MIEVERADMETLTMEMVDIGFEMEASKGKKVRAVVQITRAI
jgi:hypothetical protein